MWKDPIVAEVRRARERYGRKFQHDLSLIVEDLQQNENRLKALVAAAKRKPRKNSGPKRRKAA